MEHTLHRSSALLWQQRLVTFLRSAHRLGGALLLGLALAGAAQAAIPASERAVLLNLYDSTNGANWTNKTGWNGAAGTECSWYRVHCDGAQSHVSAIGLDRNNLTGSLPSLSGLTALQGFYVYSNQLTGAIPSLSGLTALLHFNAYGNQLTGTIPSLSGLTALQYFDVGSNQLTGTIPSLSGLTALQSFSVYSNQLTGAIPSLSGLTDLLHFNAYGNQLTGTIPSLSGLTALLLFNAYGNQLTGTIPSLSGLTALQYFDVGSNQLTGTIPSLSGLTALQSFSVSGNQLTGTIPSLNGLTALQGVWVVNNQLTGTIPSLSGLTALQYFYVYNNQLAGAIPAAPSSLLADKSNLCNNQLQSSGDAAIDAAWTTAAGNWLACQSMSASLPLCTLTATPSTVPPGSPATLTATCTPAATSYTWSGGTCTGETGPTCTAHPTETTTYTVTGHNPTGPSYPASATVTPFSVATTVVNQTTSAVFTYNPVDIGKTGNIYIFAYLDPNSPLLATSAANSQTASPRTGETVTAPRASNGLVLAVLTRTGWKQAASSGVLEALYTGTLSSTHNLFALYNNDQFKAAQDAGILCAAYTTATGTTAKGQGLPLVIGSDPNAPCPEVTLTAPSYQGLWWNPAESGWGMSITQQGSTAFTALYTYDPLGQPTWYFMSNCPISANGCNGDLYQVSGGSAPTVPWTANVNVTPVGNGQLRFTDADNATFAFSLNGQSGSQSLTRNTFATGSDRPTVDYSDLWWNKAESGWGLSLTQQYGTLFAAWYTYDASGQAVWYVLSDCPLSGNGCTSDLYQVTGGTPLSRPWNAANKQVTKVGTGTLSFTDRNNGSLSYRIDGVDGKRTLERKPL